MTIVVPLKFTPPFFFVFFITLWICQSMFCFLHIFILKNRIQSFYILQKVTEYHFCTRLLYHITLASCKCISCFSTFFRHFMELLLLPSGKDLHSNCFIFFTPKQVLCQSEIYLFLSASLFTFSFCCMFSACQSVSEKCFTQDVRHNLWEILFG